MMNRILLLTLSVLIFQHGAKAASPAATEKEYQQVRTIALRDARVQAAYRDADRRLDEKIVRIDPALEAYVKAKQDAREGRPVRKPATKPFTTAKPAAKPAAKPSAKPAPAKAPAVKKPTHVVANGETLGGIAAKHHVSVAALKDANRIRDERKLRVGQVLTVPGGKSAPQAKKEGSAFSRLLH